MGTLRTIFSKRGLGIFAYFVAGFFLGPPPGQAGHLPAKPQDLAGLLHWVAWIFQVFIWWIGLLTQHARVAL